MSIYIEGHAIPRHTAEKRLRIHVYKNMAADENITFKIKTWQKIDPKFGKQTKNTVNG